MGSIGIRPVEPRTTTFWCSAVAYPQGAGRSILFGTHLTHDARRSVRWLQMRVGQLAEQFDPKEAEPMWAWIGDEGAAAAAMRSLLAGDSYSLTVRDEQATYVFTAQFSTGSEPILPGRGVEWPI